MRKYKLFITKKAQKELNKIPNPLAKNIARKLQALGKNPRPPASNKLTGKENFRLRIGSFRAIYAVDIKKREITILRVADRKTIYR